MRVGEFKTAVEEAINTLLGSATKAKGKPFTDKQMGGFFDGLSDLAANQAFQKRMRARHQVAPKPVKKARA